MRRWVRQWFEKRIQAKAPVSGPGRRGRRARGQVLVEFALVFLVVMMFLLGVVEFGHLLFVYTATTSAAAEAARYAATTGTEPGSTVPRYQDCDAIRRAALRIGAMAGLRPEDVEIVYDWGPGTTPFAQCPNPPTAISGGERVVVTVTIYYRPWVPLFPQVTLPMQATVARTLLGEVEVAP